MIKFSLPRPKSPQLNLASKIPRVNSQNGKYIFLVMICIGSGFLGGWTASINRSQNSSSSKPSSQYVSTESQLISGIAKDVGQSVVSIDAEAQSTATDIFGYDRTVSSTSSGTGFIVSSDGTIVTNRHVIPSTSSSVSVTLSDGTRFDNVKIIGRTGDSDTLDIAFLKITDLKGKSLKALKLGDSTNVEVGERVVAIGNALGQFQNTVTAGIISGYGRDVQASDSSGSSAETLTDLFQTDAAINEGNSGGPLVNINGEVIGINTAMAGGQAQNIGFAIPINHVKGLISSVLTKGELLRPYLGVRYVSITEDVAYQYSLTVSSGAYIVPSKLSPSIVVGSPAEKAGLKEKDIITKVNDITINASNNLTSVLNQFAVGDQINLTVVRAGKTINIKVTLEAAPKG